MPRFELSRRAEADLLHIGAYTLEHWGQNQANRYLADFEACCLRLAETPLLGRSCSHISPGLRCLKQGSHVVFYRRAPGGILISRILHRRMLPTRHFIDE